jgi:NAD(P)-dependent dehydrogenase (short-subunit alcohol dehydrogenase family)
MSLTTPQRRALTLGALAVGAFAASQVWRRRQPYDFAGKSVVITGGSRGLGFVLARELAAQGAKLTLVARDEAELRRALEEIAHCQPMTEASPVTADVRSRFQAERAIEMAVDRYGTVDVLINNAGTIQVGPIDHMKLSDYEDAMRTHFWGPLHMMLAALPHMRRQRSGRIVNISSIAGRVSVPHLVPYSASKFALAGLSEGLRAELARDNIVVTTVYPGLMRTGSPVNAMFKGQRPQEYAWFAISDSLPISAIAPERAARQIVRACRYGDAELIITMQAKLVVLARTAAPELFAETMTLFNQLLPGPESKHGDEPHRREVVSEFRRSPSAP